MGERWSMLILRDLWVIGPRHFDQLQRSLAVARNILTDRLDTLVEGGVVERRLYQTRPDRYEYFLSEKGAELVPVLFSLTAWGDRHVSATLGGPPYLFEHKGHDHIADPVTMCRVCNEELTLDELQVRRGPGLPKRPARKGASSPGTGSGEDAAAG